MIMMTDVHRPEVRSFNMSRIKGKDTTPEIKVRKYLFSKGFRYRKNVTELPGKPDIVLAKHNTVIFVNGCFWHRHKGCKFATMPKSNVDFWQDKFAKNVENDKIHEQQLKKMGWNVITVWECEIKDHFEETMKMLVFRIQSNTQIDKGELEK